MEHPSFYKTNYYGFNTFYEIQVMLIKKWSQFSISKSLYNDL